MNWLQNIADFLLEAIKNEIAAVVVGVFFAQGIQKLYDYFRYGRWKIILYQEGREIVQREISTSKAKEIIKEEAELSVFLKGVISPYVHLTCDILKKGRELGLLKEDKKGRCFIVDLDKNPPKKNGMDTQSVL